MDELRNRLLDALLLAQIIPTYIMAPTSVVPEEDGDISFEWYADPKNQISIWVRGGHVSYAGLHNGNGLSGRTTERATITAVCMALLCMVVEKIRSGHSATVSQAAVSTDAPCFTQTGESK